MIHTLDLPSELENGLEAKAARLGVPVDRYIIGVLRHDVGTNGDGQAAIGAETRRVARHALEALATDTRAGMQPIPDEALSSANLYAGRGE